jgi:hypothetical protein
MSPTRRNKGSGGSAKAGSANFWAPLRAAFLIALGGVGGFFTNYWISYRADFRETLNEQINSFKEVTAPVASDLRTFFQIAEGSRAKTDEDVETLRKNLFASVTEAQLLADNIGASDVIASYQSASLELQEASEVVTGPLDARPLVQAVNDYLLAEQQLQQAAQESYKSPL